MMMRRTLMGIAGAALAVGMSATGAMAQEVTLRMHQFLPPQANVPKLILDVWADKVEAASDNKIKIERYPSMQLGGKPPELMDQAIDGVADIVWTVVGYTPGRYPTTEVFELPFMVTDARAASSAYWQMFEKHMKDTEFKDVHILGTWVHGPGMLHTNTEVRSPDDMQGLKIRGGSRLVNQLLEITGATPVGMPVPAIPEGLSKGVIDAADYTVFSTNHAQGMHEFAKYPLYPGFHSMPVIEVSLNKAIYDGLPEDLQTILNESVSVFARDMIAQLDAQNEVAVAEAQADPDITVINWSDEERAKFRGIAKSQWANWAARSEMAGKAYESVTAYLTEKGLLAE